MANDAKNGRVTKLDYSDLETHKPLLCKKKIEQERIIFKSSRIVPKGEITQKYIKLNSINDSEVKDCKFLATGNLSQAGLKKAELVGHFEFLTILGEHSNFSSHQQSPKHL